MTQAIRYVDNHKVAAPEQPYFLYLAFGACHWPHHVPQALVDKYKGRYASGWDEIRKARFARQKALGAVPPTAELPSGNPGVPAWDDLTEDERRFCERSQEVYAGFIDHTDQQIGRLLVFLDARGHAENTLIVLISDNGASPEGGPLGTVALNARKHLYHGPETSKSAAPRSTPGGPDQLPALCHRMGPGQQHPAQMVQDEHLRRRRAIAADRALAGTGRAAAPRNPSITTPST